MFRQSFVLVLIVLTLISSPRTAPAAQQGHGKVHVTKSASSTKKQIAELQQRISALEKERGKLGFDYLMQSAQLADMAKEMETLHKSRLILGLFYNEELNQAKSDISILERFQHSNLDMSSLSPTLDIELGKLAYGFLASVRDRSHALDRVGPLFEDPTRLQHGPTRQRELLNKLSKRRDVDVPNDRQIPNLIGPDIRRLIPNDDVQPYRRRGDA